MTFADRRQAPALETRGLTIRFGGHVAVDDVSCRFTPGTLTAIVGPNGAGKTTYFNLISGQLRASAGPGAARRRGHHAAARRRARTRAASAAPSSSPTCSRSLTVLENVRLAVQSRAGAGWSLFAVWIDRTRPDRAGRARPRARAPCRQARTSRRRRLPHGDQRKLEVALLIALEPKVFMFDEPTAGMSVDEVPVDPRPDPRASRQRRDKTILLVEHKMDVVRSLADRIIVLHNGTLVADGEPAEVIASPVVQEAYLGRRRGGRMS